MRIIHINFSFTSGGIDTMMVDIINFQVKICDVDLIIVNDMINYEILNHINKNVKIHLIKRPQGSKNPVYIFKLNKIIYKLKPNFIHCHNNNLIGLLFTNVKKGLTIHALDLPVNSLKKYDQLFAISNAVRKDVKSRSSIDAIVIHNGIDFSLLTKQFGSSSNQIFRIIQVSRLEHINGAGKGQHILILALSILKYKLNFNNIEVDFIGEGPSYEYLNNLTKELQLENNVNFIGNKSREFIYKILSQYDLLVQPSLNEGFGLTILEGIGSKIPVLASDKNGPLEISQILNYNFLFETGNPEKLADAILEIYSKKNDPDYLKKLDEYSIKAKGLFSIEQTANNYIKEYQKLI